MSDDRTKHIVEKTVEIHITVENPCPKCHGRGTYVYPNTTTWRGGIGGQAMTPGICNACWGSGTTLWSGPNARKMNAQIKELRRKLKEGSGE